MTLRPNLSVQGNFVESWSPNPSLQEPPGVRGVLQFWHLPSKASSCLHQGSPWLRISGTVGMLEGLGRRAVDIMEEGNSTLLSAGPASRGRPASPEPRSNAVSLLGVSVL